MRLDYTVIIDRPVQEVWDYVNDRDKLELWLNDFVRYEHVSGDVDAPKVGDQSNMVYRQGKSEFTMLEEITEFDAPRHIKLRMTCKMFDMDIINDFEAVDSNQTKLFAGANFIRLGLLMKAVMLFSSKKKMQADHERQINKLRDLIEGNSHASASGLER